MTLSSLHQFCKVKPTDSTICSIISPYQYSSKHTVTLHVYWSHLKWCQESYIRFMIFHWCCFLLLLPFPLVKSTTQSLHLQCLKYPKYHLKPNKKSKQKQVSPSFLRGNQKNTIMHNNDFTKSGDHLFTCLQNIIEAHELRRIFRAIWH